MDVAGMADEGLGKWGDSVNLSSGKPAIDTTPR
jgi:hypothetical protein